MKTPRSVARARPAPLVHRPGARRLGQDRAAGAPLHASSSRRCRSPKKIVAITFTIKAAAEMRERVLKKLPNSAEIAHRLRIQTIDAFCAVAHAPDAGACRASARSPGSSRTRSEHYREAAQRTIDELSPAAVPAARCTSTTTSHTAASLIAGDAREARPVAAQDRRCADARRAGSHPPGRTRAHPRARAARCIRKPRPSSPPPRSPERTPGASAATPSRPRSRPSRCARRSRRCCACRASATTTSSGRRWARSSSSCRSPPRT